MEPQEVIPRIKELVSESLLTEAAFANKVGLSPSNLHKKLRGEQTITPRDIKLISNALNVLPEWLLHGTGEKYITENNELSMTIKNVIVGLVRKLSQNEERINNLKRENQDIMSKLSALYIQLDTKL